MPNHVRRHTSISLCLSLPLPLPLPLTLTRVESPDCSDFSSALRGADVSTLDLNVVPLGKGSALEGEAFELSTTAHIQYTLGTATKKPYRGIIRVQKTTDRLTVSPGGWKIDEDVFPLEAPKAIALMQPRRNEFGERYLEFESGRASYR